MPNNPQRPTEDEAMLRLPFYDVLTTELSYTRGARANTIRSYRGKQHQVVMICTPLWFDPDEDVEIENPEDEPPEFEE